MDGLNGKVAKVGTIMALCAIVANFLPVLYLWIVYGEIPTSSQLVSILSMIFVTSAVSWIVQPLSHCGGLGMVGTYISWISGSAADIQLPSINMAQKVTNMEVNIPEEDAISAMALPASVSTTVGTISVLAVVGSRIVPFLPEVITQSSTYMQLALFAAAFVNMAMKNLKPGFTTLVLGLLYCFALPQLGLSIAWLMLIAVTGGLVIDILFARKGARKTAPSSK